jgi:putative FmdB family regulatory protein
MPIYAYRCDDCGHEFDALQRISDAPLTICPACEAPALRKQLTAPAFRLKGSGWYETDFKKDGRKNLHDGGAEAKDGTGAAEAGKGEQAKGQTAKDAPAKGDGAKAKPASDKAAAPASGNKAGGGAAGKPGGGAKAAA